MERSMQRPIEKLAGNEMPKSITFTKSEKTKMKEWLAKRAASNECMKKVKFTPN